MAKKMRKMIASLLVLCMCISAATVTTSAADITVPIDTTAGTVEGTQTTTDSPVITNEDGTTTQTQTVVTQTPEGGVTSEAGNVTTTVEYLETVISSETHNADDQLIADSGSVVGEEIVTQTTTTTNSPVEEEIYAGSVEITFGEDGTGTGTAESAQPEAPADGENIQTGEDSVTWETYEEEPVAPAEGDGTDVNGDEIVDSITTQSITVTTTTVTVTDRTVEAELTESTDVPADFIDEAEATGEVEGIGGAELPAGESWTEVNGDKQAQIEKIQDQLYFGTEDAAKAAATQLALDAIVRGEDIPEDTAADVKAAAEALIAAAKAENTAAAPETPKTPEISISNVSLTVNEKVAGNANNADLDTTNDVYNASVKFDVVVTEDVNGEMTVVVRQNGQDVASQTLTEFDKNDDGSYSVNIRDMQLQEGGKEMAVDLDIRLDGVQQLTSKQMYTHTTTTQVPAQKPDDQTLSGYTSHSGNEKNEESGNMIADTSSWNTGSHDQNFTVGNATVNIKADGKTSDGDREVVTVTSTETIKADYIIIKAANGYIKYAVPGGILHEGVAYTVENDYNSEIGKTGGISHVTVWGSGEEVDIPAEEITKIVLGEADQSREVVLNAGVTLNFEVDEAIKTTNSNEQKTVVTTRTWADSYDNTYVPDETVPDETVPDETVPDETVPDETVPDETVPDETVPDETVPDETNPNEMPPTNPTQPTGGNDPDPTTPSEPETPTNPPEPHTPAEASDSIMILAEDDGLVEIEDEDVPLADAPKTGDITLILAAVSLFSAGGLQVLNRKREEDE